MFFIWIHPFKCYISILGIFVFISLILKDLVTPLHNSNIFCEMYGIRASIIQQIFHNSAPKNLYPDYTHTCTHKHLEKKKSLILLILSFPSSATWLKDWYFRFTLFVNQGIHMLSSTQQSYIYCIF